MTSTATWIETFTGQHVNLIDPDPSTISIRDIAHHLANTNRFGGATAKPYSVAEHCVRMSFITPKHLRFEALMHDAAEAYIGDMPSPYKLVMPEFKEFEARLEACIRRAFEMPGAAHPTTVKWYDNMMLITEARDLGLSWWDTNKHTGMPEPLEGLIVPWGHELAEARFLERFETLRNQGL